MADITITGIASTVAFGTPRVAKRSALQSAPDQPTTSAPTTVAVNQAATLATASGPATAS